MVIGWRSAGSGVGPARDTLGRCWGDTRMLLLLKPGAADSCLLCAIYGPPGADRIFWDELIREKQMLAQRERPSRTLVVGDCNLHPPWLVDHGSQCTCSHCRPSSADAHAVGALRSARLCCHNPVGCPTHVSGTSTDHIWSDGLGDALHVQVLPPGSLAQSDHGLVYTLLSLSFRPSYERGFGRVALASSLGWERALSEVDDFLGSLATLFESLAADPQLLQWADDLRQPKRRRAVLDGCAWL